MKIYNTLSGKKEAFEPLQEMKVGMYVCGPTVYDLAHLGHGRSAVSFDVIRRYLIYKGYNVNFVSNYTDIDDKMINRAEIMKITVKELAEKIIPEYAKDYDSLGIMVPDVLPKATEHIPQMIELIQKLEKKEATYVLDDGVYFDISKFKDYGKLSKQDLEALRSGIRVEVKESKRNPQDFVLWKFSKPGEPAWNSSWGSGRPGWHIECSAMSRQYLGDSFDIHGGGADLTFPHHECEIAQSECALNKPFSKYWLHNGFIQINNEKMSKSLGNFFLLRDVFAKYPAQAVRYLFLQTHYRSPIEFTDSILEQSKNGLMRFHNFIRNLENYEQQSDYINDVLDKNIDDLLSETEKRFNEAMDDDFDTPAALAACFELIRKVNVNISMHVLVEALEALNKTKASDEIQYINLTLKSKEKILVFLHKIDSVLGIIFSNIDETVDDEIMMLIEKREEARKNKNWKASDEIRDELLKKGIQLEDSPKGTLWKRI